MECKICGQDNPREARFCANCGSDLTDTGKQVLVTTVASSAPIKAEMAVEYSGFFIRFAAALIDAIAIWIISGAFSLFLGIFQAFPYFYFYSGALPVLILYFWLFTWLKGQTPGKMLVGIKVVNAKGDKPDLISAALREIVGKLLSSIILYLGFLWILVDNRKQGLHDKIGSTFVVKVESKK